MESNRADERAERQTATSRGLDQVSHLLLSHVSERAFRGRSQIESERAIHPPQEGQTSAVVLRNSRPVVREQLLSVLAQQPAVLEEGMKVIDANLPCETPGNMELLALDSANQLVVIEVDDKPNDSLLLRGMAHLNWVIANIPVLRRMYQGQVINFSLQPRLFLVAPDFSPLFLSAMYQTRSLKLHCVKYHTVDLVGGPGIFCERLMLSS